MAHSSLAANAPQPILVPVWQPWLVCFSAALFFFYEFFQLNVFDVINPLLRNEFQLNALQLSWMSSAFIWANVLFLLPAGIILDRFSVRWVIRLAMALCVLGTLGLAFTQSFLSAAACRALTGVGNAFCFLACVILVARWFPPRRQAFVIGGIVTMAFIGGMMAHTPLAYLIAHFGWRGALVIDAAVGAAMLAWIYLVVTDKGATPPSKMSTMTWWDDVYRACLNRQNWFAGMYTACLNLPIMVLCALWGASYLYSVHHLSPIAASNMMSLIFTGSVIGCPLFGWLSDRIGKRKPMMLMGAVLTCFITLFLVFNIALSVMSLSGLFFALGFFSSTQVISYPFIAESNPPSQTGAATGLASVLIMGGAGLGQILFGQLIQHHAGGVPQYYSAGDFEFAMAMFPIAGLMALVVLLLMRETGCKNSVI